MATNNVTMEPDGTISINSVARLCSLKQYGRASLSEIEFLLDYGDAYFPTLKNTGDDADDGDGGDDEEGDADAAGGKGSGWRGKGRGLGGKDGVRRGRKSDRTTVLRTSS